MKKKFLPSIHGFKVIRCKLQETHPLKIGMVLKNGREKEWVKQPHDLEAKGLQKLQKNIENVHSFRTQAEFKLVMGPGIPEAIPKLKIPSQTRFFSMPKIGTKFLSFGNSLTPESFFFLTTRSFPHI